MKLIKIEYFPTEKVLALQSIIDSMTSLFHKIL
jgi:hypothetical protein